MFNKSEAQHKEGTFRTYWVGQTQAAKALY